MTDILGYRGVFGVIGPSTNTVVQPDMDDLRPRGVTNHYARIYTPDAQAVSDESFMAGARTIGDNTLEAVCSIMTASPDYLVMGMSAVTFFGGRTGADTFQRSIEAESGRGVSIGSHATAAALEQLGARRVAVLTPYFPSANAEVVRYLTECGFEVARDTCLRCPSWTAIAAVPPERLRQEIQALDGPDIDAIVQVGTNLSMIRLAAAAELWLGKPVLAINTATYWHALRQHGITDRVAGFGTLLERH